MKKDHKIFLKHITESIDAIEQFAKGMSRTDFKRSLKTQDAVIRRLTIIGEAVKNLPASFRKKHEHIPWSELARMRDKLTHGYFGVSLDITWDVLEKDLPQLKKSINRIIEE